MPAKCSVPGCSTKAEKGSGPRFYCIPSEINFTGKASPLRVSRRKKWIVALKLQHLQDHQLKNIRICGQHFVTGKPADQYFVNHPDWIPSQHLHIKDSKATNQAKSDFLNKLQLDGIKRSSSGSAKKITSLSDEATSEFTSDELHKYSMPQKRCCVASCLNRMSKTKNSSPPIYYHKFPEDSLYRSRWMFLCQKKGTWEPDHCYICSEHFISDDYIIEGILKELTVPTSNLFSNEYKSSSSKDNLIILEGRSGLCSIPWCKSNHNEGKKMEPFPGDKILQKAWMDNIFGGQVPVIPSERAVICQDHFAADQWLESSEGSSLKGKAVPKLFNFSLKTSSLSKEPVKRRTDSLKEKETKQKSKKDITGEELEDKLEETLRSCVGVSSFIPDKVVKVVRVVKRQFLSDHTYSGMDSQDSKSSSSVEEFKKIKIESLISNHESKNISTKELSDVDAYNNIEELMADLMGEDCVTENNAIAKVNELHTVLKSEPKTRFIEDPHDSLDDYSDYSETDSDSDTEKSTKKSVEKLSDNELKELAEAQKFQLHDLKSENKELIDENERLRNELNLLKSDPEHASLNLEKSKFMNLVVKLLQNFLNVDQILYLIKVNDPSNAIVWSSETLSKALEIHKACSDSGYDLLVDRGFPLPPRRLFFMLNRDKTKFSKDDKDI